MGGSPQFEFQERTTGILSGLDGPKLNASRTGMANGGNPFGFGGTVTAGIVSARGRNIGGSYDDYIQTDASIK